MKVGLVVGRNIFHTGVSGYGRMLKPALEALGDEVDLVPLTRRELKVFGRPVGGYVMYWGVRLLERRRPYDIIHALDPVTATRATDVVTMHDLVVEEYPQWYQADAGARMEWRFTKRLAQRTPWMLSQSETTRQKIIKGWGRDPDTIVTVYQGFNDKVFVPTPGGSPHLAPDRPNLVFVGDDNPRKNVILAVRATAELEKLTGKRARLLRIGSVRYPDVNAAFNAEAKKLGVDLVEPGPLKDDEIARIYTAADAFVWPSVAEGFGLPPCEAFSCGCPVVANDIPVNREVFGDAAIYHVDDPRSMAEALRQALEARPDAQKLRRQAGLYTWERTAAGTQALYERAMRR